MIHPFSMKNRSWGLSHQEMTQKKLQCILLSKRSQSEMDTYGMIPTIWYSRKGKNCGDSKMISDCQGLEKGDELVEHRGFVGQWKYSVGFAGVSAVGNLPANAGATGNAGSIPGRFPGEWNGNLFQCSCWANPMDKGAGKYSGCYYQYNDGHIILHVSRFI